MQNQAVISIIDTGFAGGVVAAADKVLGVYDLNNQFKAWDAGGLGKRVLQSFAGDLRKPHGSMVLDRTLTLAPASPLVLIRAFDSEGNMVHGNDDSSSPLWMEGLLWAVGKCRELGLSSVTNCSFGGFDGAMDGTGRDASRLATVTGKGKPGHVVVAAAGPGDGRAVHASWDVGPGQTERIAVEQKETTLYNFWAGQGVPDDFRLGVRRNGVLIQEFCAQRMPRSPWNNCRYRSFEVSGRADVVFTLTREGTAGGGIDSKSNFDCWICDDTARFLDHHQGREVIVEPAIFPHVLAVGLKQGTYSPDQNKPGRKPDVLLQGQGFISMRIPEVTAKVAEMLSADPALDVDQVRTRLGKFR